MWAYFCIPSNRRLGSFSSRVSSSLAALRILARVNLTLQTSRLFLSPYSPEKMQKVNNLCCYDYYLKYPSSFHCSVNETTYQWALTPGQDGTSQRVGGGWRMSCDKPSSWQRAWRLRCAYNSKTVFILPILQLFSNLNLNPEHPALIWRSISI